MLKLTSPQSGTDIYISFALSKNDRYKEFYEQ